MSPIWSDLALARATRESVARDESGQSESAVCRDRDSPGHRGLQPVRRLIHPSWTSLALKQLSEARR
jgi:hypothetical protein